MDRGWWSKTYYGGFLWFVAAMLVAGLAGGIWGSWYFLISVPRTYDRLERVGVRVPATFDYVDPPGRDRYRNNDGYLLTFYVRGHRYEERAFDNFSQFHRVGASDRVPVLVDPEDPGTAFTVAAVRARANSGFGLGSAASLFLIMFCAWKLAGEIRWWRWMREPTH